MGPIFHPIFHFLMEWAMAGRAEKWMEVGGIFLKWVKWEIPKNLWDFDYFCCFFLNFFQKIVKFDRKLSNMGHQVRKIVDLVTLFVDSVQIDRF